MNDDESNQPLSLWQELKRRKVIKVIMLYATTSYVLLQALALIIGPLHLPEWVMTLVVVLLAIGFPIALIFSWIFDITPDGIQVTAKAHAEDANHLESGPNKNSRRTNIIIAALLVLVAILATPQVLHAIRSANIDPSLDKSIAVLPFSNDSSDTGNVYLINGLMESILNNLAKIKDLKVISRTSVEKYRHETNSNRLMQTPQIAQELNANYIVEGSGQKYGDEILLSVQLLEGKTDRHLWSKQYRRKTNDIIDLQIEVAKSIADEIHAVITPEEDTRIAKLPTQNRAAYDAYLKGLSFLPNWPSESYPGDSILFNAREQFEKAIAADKTFALAYAALAETYFVLGDNESQKGRKELVNSNADLAILYDPTLAESYTAKAYYYLLNYQQDLAILFFERALHFNPSYARAIRWLALEYILKDTEKYLYYALKASQLDITGKSPTEIASDYIGLSRSFRFVGFFDEAEHYLQLAEATKASPALAVEERAEILGDIHSDYQQAWELLNTYMTKGENLSQSLIRCAAQTSYFRRDWQTAANYYQQITVDWWPNDDGRIGATLNELGKKEEAEERFKRFEAYLAQDQTPHKYRLLAELQAYRGQTDAALANMEIFARADNIPYWAIRFFRDDPMYDNIRELPKFKELLDQMEARFWKNRDRIKAELEQQGLLNWRL